MRLKNLDNVYPKEFDLILFDAVTGLEYRNPKFEIHSGSSVIVKRVPVGRVEFPMFKYQSLDATKLRDAIQEGLDQNKPKKIVPEEKLESDSGEQMESENVASESSLEALYADLIPEQKCRICKTYCKEAVILPCCNRRFCDKYFRKVLAVTGSCPNCSSTKCGIPPLLQGLADVNVPEHNTQIYAPDGESCIKGDDISFVVPVNKNLPNSTSNMKKGSNDGTVDSAYNSQDLNQALLIPQVSMSVEGGDRRFPDRSRNSTVRTCYLCHLPSHFLRDCPMASSQHPMSHAGDPMWQGGMPYYAPPPYWDSVAFPPINPYMNMYEMMHFDRSMLPFTPHHVSQYLPSMYGGLRAPRYDEMRNMKNYHHSTNFCERQSGDIFTCSRNQIQKEWGVKRKVNLDGRLFIKDSYEDRREDHRHKRNKYY